MHLRGRPWIECYYSHLVIVLDSSKQWLATREDGAEGLVLRKGHDGEELQAKGTNR